MMLEFKNVTIDIHRKNIVKDINITVKRGEITVLLGKNGSGKSTLLRAANGLLKYDGEILLDGRQLGTLSSKERAQKVAFLPQILPSTAMTVRQLVQLGRHPYSGPLGVLSSEDIEAVERALAGAEVAELAERAVNTLSGGERQRAFVAMLLAQQTPLLIMDEPTTYMDISAKKDLERLCRKLAAEGKTLLLVLHDLSEAVRLADNMVLLYDASVRFEGARQDCLEQNILEKTFDVERRKCDGDIFFV